MLSSKVYQTFSSSLKITPFLATDTPFTVNSFIILSLLSDVVSDFSFVGSSCVPESTCFKYVIVPFSPSFLSISTSTAKSSFA